MTSFLLVVILNVNNNYDVVVKKFNDKESCEYIKELTLSLPLRSVKEIKCIELK